MEFTTMSEQILFYMGAISSALFIVKLLLMLIGGDLEGGDFEFEADAGDSDGDFSALSVNSVLCFFMGLGWVGLASLTEWGYSFYPSLGLGFLGGLASSCLFSGLFFFAKKLNHTPDTPTVKKGDTGQVYIKIPQHGIGKIRVNNQIVQATCDEELRSFTPIEVLEEKTIDINTVVRVAKTL